MPKQTHRPRYSTEQAGEELDEVTVNQAQARRERRQEKSIEQDEGLDDLLDEIDELLEINATDFVEAYVQGGGE